MNLSLRKSLALAAAGATLALAAPFVGAAQDTGDVEAEAAEMTKGEKRLAKLLEDRVAGEPVDCIRVVPSQPMQAIDGTAYVYGRGNTIYVQRTASPETIDDDDILVSRRFRASELCRLDVMTTVDRFNGFFTGAVFLEDFVPYTRVKDAGDGAETGAETEA
jgi:hypothetical protein